MYYLIPIFVLILLVLHEVGHIIAAKTLHLSIEKISFSWKPVPRMFVSIIDNNIPTRRRLIYLLSGTLMTSFLFLVFYILKKPIHSLYYAFAYQLIVETNPFFSDFVVAIISYKSRKEFSAEFFKSKYSKQPVTEDNIKLFTGKHMFSWVWYVHFLIWSALIIILLSPIGLFSSISSISK